MPRIRGKDPRPQKKSSGTKPEVQDDQDAKPRKRQSAQPVERKSAKRSSGKRR